MINPWQFVKEAKNELFKVVWPTRAEIIRITIVVILISLAVAVFLGAIDFGLSKLIKYVVERR
ncbi:MAG: preprotein translocase subunit SecE [Candidatus Doudnabacteria bacterium]|nr:preprotein translocase subunit SecE [Candidatus Doudnabacteria bacterium]